VNDSAGVEVQAELRQLGECTFVQCDVTDDTALAQAVAQAVATFGRLDSAFNAAGIDGEHGKPTAECTMENWNRVMAVDLTGVFSCLRHEIPESSRRVAGPS
jgi:NAD(P)-dependent dehydrogenase (short-subunit alcohol dehydrogenase family)